MVRHVIVGTAGHVDHGKSALVTALTGQDPDRLPEEKKRGLTIELGYAWCDLSGRDEDEQLRIGFVDVPGHEHFIDHMVSGVTGMDLVLFTVAADEGLMPQSFEHLEILQILGVQRGIIVLTKCDRADSAAVDSLIQKIQQETADTFLEGAPVVRTSARTGEGIEELRACMRDTILSAGDADRSDGGRHRTADGTEEQLPARLPVDRVFSLPGFGTIVTGTMVSGSMEQESRLAVYPQGTPCRARGIQSYGQEESHVSAGQRAALNLAKISTDQVHRGDVVAAEGSLKPAVFLNVSLISSRYSRREIESGMRVHLLIGTAHVLARMVLFRDDEHLAQLRLESPVAVLPGDRFILRFYSPPETIGGGVVLESVDRKCRMSDRRVLARLQALERGEEPPVDENENRRESGASDESSPAGHKQAIPAELQKCTDWLIDIHRQAGCKLLSANSLSDDSAFNEEKIRRSLRLLEKRGELVRLDETHYTVPEAAAHVEDLIRGHFKEHDELVLGDLRDLLAANRTSARAFFAYLDRRKITQQTGGASTRTPGPAL